MMYHDQGQIATKLLGFNKGVTVTAGLKTVFTTPAHGTAFDIVGQGKADPGALEHAFTLAAKLAAARSAARPPTARKFDRRISFRHHPNATINQEDTMHQTLETARPDLRHSTPLAARRRRITRPSRSACWSALRPAAARTPPRARWAGKLSERLGQQVIIDNRPGAAGNIATEITAKATPDGYTILMGTIAALAINPSLYKKLPFDPLKDVLPIIARGGLDQHSGRASLGSGQKREGTHRARQDEIAERRLVRHRRRRPSRAGTVQPAGRDQDRARAVQGRRPGDGRSARRPTSS